MLSNKNADISQTSSTCIDFKNDKSLAQHRVYSEAKKMVFSVPPLRHQRDITCDFDKHQNDINFFWPGKNHHRLIRELKSVPGVVIAVFLNLMLCVPFGLSFFPIEWQDIPISRSDGIQMFLLTTVICQFVFTWLSAFNCALGLMMVENIPFMHTLSLSIIHELGPKNPATLPTIVVTYSLSSIFVGTIFYLLGRFKLGSIVHFFPKHIIVGAIGGIGIFVTKTGLENATGVPFKWNWSSLKGLFLENVFWLWATALVLVVALSSLTRWIKSPLFPPIYFVSIPVMFFVMMFILGIPYEVAYSSGWFFEQAPAVNFWKMWYPFDFSLVQWWVIPRQFGTLIGLSLFSLMHVPINIPSLSLTTGVEVDVNKEIIAHGLSNVLGGLCGSVQNYLCYSNSALYFKCGGRGKIGGVFVGLLTGVFFFIGPSVLAYIPRCMAGCLMIHIGLDLMKDAVIDTYGILDTFEYLTVWVITIVMTFFGMNEGLIIGAILACFTFVAQSLPVNPLRGSMSGSTLRSNCWRKSEALNILNSVSRHIHVIQLQGHIFFGNVAKLSNYASNTLDNNVETEFLVMDFTLVITMDSSATDGLLKLKRLCDMRKCHLVFVAIPDKHDRFRQQIVNALGSCDRCPDSISQGVGFYVASDLNEAIGWCEDGFLQKYTRVLSNGNRDNILQKTLFCDRTSSHLNYLQALCPEQPLEVFNRMMDYFIMERIDKDVILWRQGDESNSAAFLASGSLRAEIEDEDGTTENVSIGQMVGEVCLCTGERRMSTLKATSNSVIYVLSRKKFEEMLQKDAFVAFVFQSIALRYSSHRLQYVGNRIWETKCLPI